MGSGGLKGGIAEAPTYGTESTGQTHLFLQKRTYSVQTRQSHIHPQSVPSLPTWTLFSGITKTARSTHLLRPRAGTPHRGSAYSARTSPFSGSCRPWACSPWTLRSEDGETVPTCPALDSLSSPSPAWISYWCPVKPGSAPFVSQCGLPTLQIVR